MIVEAIEKMAILLCFWFNDFLKMAVPHFFPYIDIAVEKADAVQTEITQNSLNQIQIRQAVFPMFFQPYEIITCDRFVKAVHTVFRILYIRGMIWERQNCSFTGDARRFRKKQLSPFLGDMLQYIERHDKIKATVFKRQV